MLHTSVSSAQLVTQLLILTTSYFPVQRSPSSAVSIRAIETVRYKVIDKLNDKVLEEIEESKAFFQVIEKSFLCVLLS